MTTPFTCPHCQSDNTQAISVLLQAGTIQGAIKGGAVGYSQGGGLGGSAFSGATSQQSDLARRFSPGARPEARTWAMLLGLFMVLFGALMGSTGQAGCAAGVIIPGAILLLIYLSDRSGLPLRRTRWQDAIERAKRGWVCLRCGRDWEPTLG